LTDNLAVAEIMMLINEAVVEGFKGGVPNHVNGYRAIVGNIPQQGILIHE